MHELSIAQNIISIVEESAKTLANSKVTNIHLRVGKMSNVLVDSLCFCFESLIDGTRLGGAKLIIEEIPVTLFCNNCSQKTEISEFSFSCANCSSTNVEMKSGNELEICKVELD